MPKSVQTHEWDTASFHWSCDEIDPEGDGYISGLFFVKDGTDEPLIEISGGFATLGEAKRFADQYEIEHGTESSS